MKKVIVINGKGGVGKDTLCDFVSKRFKVMNVSAVDPIKKIAKELGWNGEKDNKSRKMLSDLKKLAIDYNDFPNTYLCEQHKLFLGNDSDIMFVHIREPEEIKHFIDSINNQGLTLLIRRKSCNQVYGNYSDDSVENYPYNYIYDNDLPLDEAETNFINFFASILNNH